jgi:hypothetical protein
VQEKPPKFCGYGILDSAGGLGSGDTLRVSSEDTVASTGLPYASSDASKPTGFGLSRANYFLTACKLLQLLRVHIFRAEDGAGISSGFHREVLSSTVSAQAAEDFQLRCAKFCRRVSTAKTLERSTLAERRFAVTLVAAGNSRG